MVQMTELGGKTKKEICEEGNLRFELDLEQR